MTCPPLAVGRTYVVFARSLGRPEGYPESLGETLFTLAGEPAVATLKGDDLVFLASTRYSDELVQAGLKPADGSSAAPFAVSLPALRASLQR